jgi:hypothetical protein
MNIGLIILWILGLIILIFGFIKVKSAHKAFYLIHNRDRLISEWHTIVDKFQKWLSENPSVKDRPMTKEELIENEKLWKERIKIEKLFWVNDDKIRWAIRRHRADWPYIRFSEDMYIYDRPHIEFSEDMFDLTEDNIGSVLIEFDHGITALIVGSSIWLIATMLTCIKIFL